MKKVLLMLLLMLPYFVFAKEDVYIESIELYKNDNVEIIKEATVDGLNIDLSLKFHEVSSNIIYKIVIKNDTNKLVGILTRSDMITNPDEEQIAMLMTRDLITAKMDDDLKTVAEKMVENNIRRIPVVNDDDELVGIVTSFDIVALAIADMGIKEPVEDYMIKTIPATWDETPLNVAFEVMKFFGLKSVIGLNSNNRMTGILTETDFIAESEIISERTEHSSSVGTEGDKWSWDSTSDSYPSGSNSP